MAASYPKATKQPPPSIPPVVERVHQRLAGAGERSLLAGGAVRDHILGREPKDFDIATSARPEVVEGLFDKTVMVGAQFGVVKVVEADGEVEVATFRADLGYLDGRRPVAVRFSGEREDALRRDFTINGFFYDLDSEEVIDHVGGLDDLDRRSIRAIGDPRERFSEDRLRLLRAIRFASLLAFSIEDRTWEAVLELAEQVKDVSGERIRDELEKMLCQPRRELAYHMLTDSGLMRAILPEVNEMRGCPQPPEFHPEGDVHVHTGLVLSHLREPSFTLALGALLHDIGKPPTLKHADRIRFNGHDKIGSEMAESICERLRLSRRQKERVTYLVARHMVFLNISVMRNASRTRLFDEEGFEELLDLCRADTLGSLGNLELHSNSKKLYEEYVAAGPPTEPLLKGRDLIELGIEPGPKIGELLTHLEDARRDGEVAGREAAVNWVRQRLAEEEA